MDRIPFDTFYVGVKDILTEDLFKVLNPFQGGFYKSTTTYLQLEFPQEDHLSVVMVAGRGNTWHKQLRS